MGDSKPCKNCDGLARKNMELEIKIKKVESKLSYYENPHSPPSDDSIYWRKQKKERKSSSPSKPGQKDGHKGVTHSFKPTRTINHTVEKCLMCNSTNIIQTTQQTRIIAEIPKPQPITVTKHVIPSYLCKNCGGSTTVSGAIPKKGCLGFNLIGIITSLWSARITVRNIAKMLKSFYCITLSPTCINNSLHNTSLALKPFVQQIRNDISSSDSAYFDETKYSINGDTGWIWTAVNHNSCFITVENSRGRNVLKQHFESFSGVAVCDGWGAYKIFDIRQRCWAHILREAKHYSEKLDTKNSASLYHYLQKLFFVTSSSKTKEPNQLAYDSSVELLERIISEHVNEKELKKFLTKLNNAKNDLFTFLLYCTVEPTNNTAERA